MFNRVIWWVLAVGALALAAYDGGPRETDRLSLFVLLGADPPPDMNCNTNGFQTVQCPNAPNETCMSPKAVYSKCKPANKGVLQTKLCDPGTGNVVCQGYSGCAPVNPDRIVDPKIQGCAEYTPP